MYYIYEIPGVKIGCTRDDQFHKRQKKQLDKGQMIILEEHENIYVASDRERDLQKAKGYRVDVRPYYETVDLTSNAGKLGGQTNKESGHLKNIASLGSTSPNAGCKQKRTCPHCGKVSTAAGIGMHIKHKH